jgi:hypothetical protein
MELEKIGKSKRAVVINSERQRDWAQELKEYEQGKVDLEYPQRGGFSGVHGPSIQP